MLSWPRRTAISLPEALPAAAASAAQRAANPRAKWGNLLLPLLHCMTTSLVKVGRIFLLVIISKPRTIDPSSTMPMLADKNVVGYTMSARIMLGPLLTQGGFECRARHQMLRHHKRTR